MAVEIPGTMSEGPELNVRKTNPLHFLRLKTQAH
jgi:hypothetical protein